MPPAKFAPKICNLLLFVDNFNFCPIQLLPVPKSLTAMILSHGQHRQSLHLFLFQHACAEQIIVAVSIEARQLGNGVDKVVNPALGASENFYESMERGKGNLL